jgi:beta-N-acetylhexosaminidase
MMMNGDTLFAGSVSNAFRLAIEAGNDIIISSTTARLNEALWTNNLALMGSNPAFKARVMEAAYRIIKTKLDYFKNSNHAPLYPNPDEIQKNIPNREGQQFFLEQACRSITLYQQGKDFPLKPERAGRVLLCGSVQEFFTAGKRRYPNSAEFRFTYDMGPNMAQWVYDNIMNTAAGFDTIVFSVSNKNDMKAASKLQGTGKRVIILSIMSPVESMNATWADSILIGYSFSPYSFEALFGALSGEFTPRGILPITKTE